MDKRETLKRNFNSKVRNRRVGMTTEELRTRKNAREGFKRPKDLRLNIKKAGSSMLDARSKIHRKRSIEELVQTSSINLDERRKQQRFNVQPSTGNRSLSLDSGTIKITAKQNLPPNRSAEMAGKSIVVTAKVESKDKPKQRGKARDRNPKLMGEGGITITAKAGTPQRKKRQSNVSSRDGGVKEDLDLDYREYKKLKEEKEESMASRFEQGYLSSPSRRNTTPLAERLDHGPIPDLLGTPVTSTRVTISNLHPSVSRQDIEELFGAVGVLKSCKIIGPGAAEVVYTIKEDAVTAYARYHNRNLDGQPMQCKLSVVQTTPRDTTPLARPLAPLCTTGLSSPKLYAPAFESYQPPKKSPASMPAASRPVVFKVKI